MTMQNQSFSWVSYRTELPLPDDMSQAEKIFIASFPPEERMEWSRLTSNIWDERGRMDVVKQADRVVGFAFTEHLDLMGYHYLTYLAVCNKIRGNGLGGWMLGKLMEEATQDGKKGLVFDIEHPFATPREEVRDVRKHRMNFYKRHGARVLTETWDYRVPVGERYVLRHLLAIPAEGGCLPDPENLPELVRAIMLELYQCLPDDPNLQRMLNTLTIPRASEKHVSKAM